MDRQATAWTGHFEVDPPTQWACRDDIRPLLGTEWWDKMADAEKGEARHLEAWRFSQFMHGEQGALICTAKIVETGAGHRLRSTTPPPR